MVAICGIGIIFPTYGAPKLVETTVDGVILFEEEDLTQKNSKWDAFVGGGADPDVNLEL